MRRRTVAWLALGIATATATAARTPDPAAARDQYRLARRLAVDNASGADQALRKVVELDPQGALADDALVERSLLRGVASRPEALGKIDAEAAAEAGSWLRQAASLPDADRALEARYLLALGRLEPISGWDAEGARRDLLAVAAAGPSTVWSARARYAAGWVDHAQGEVSRARGAWMRVVLDAPGSDAAAWAAAGLARIELVGGNPGRAATWVQAALDAGEGEDAVAARLRAAAVRDLTRMSNPARGGTAWSARPVATVGRSVSAMVRDPAGGIVFADRREGTVRRVDPEGRLAERWTLDDATALAVDPFGRLLAAAGERVFLLDREGAHPRGNLGRFASASSLAPDPSGAVHVLDRKGDRVGVLLPGTAAAVAVREDRGTRLASLHAVGGRLVGTGAREGRLVLLDRSGRETSLANVPTEGVVSACVDPAGRFVLLDDRSGGVVTVDSAGKTLHRLDVRTRGIVKPALVACGDDGSLDVYDASTGQVWRIGE